MLTFFSFFLPHIALAQNYAPLVSLPGINAGTPSDLTSYLNAVFSVGIGIAAALAVLMIVIGGIQYMSTDAVGGKEEAKGRITSALWGLLLALCSVLILTTINPQLLNTSLQSFTPQNIGAVSLAPVAGAPDNYGYYDEDDVAGSSDAFQNAAQSFNGVDFNGSTINANNVALDTDGTGDPGFDDQPVLINGVWVPQHQGQTSLGGLNSITDYYVAVPTNSGIPMGTPILVTDNTTGQTVQAIAGDNGATGYGEMSIATAQALGLWSPGMGNSINPNNHSVSFTVGTKSANSTQAH